MSNENHDKLRAAGLAARPARNRRLITYEGLEYEVRAPSLAVQDLISEQAVTLIRDSAGKVVERRPNQVKAVALGFIHCIFNPENGQSVYKRSDLDAIMAQPLTEGGLFHIVSQALAEMLKDSSQSMEEEKGNSEASLSA